MIFLNKKLVFSLIFKCIILVILVIYLIIPKNISEDKALDILLEYDLGLYTGIEHFQILGSDYNGIIDLDGEKYYMFSFMEKETKNSQGSHIAYNFVVSMDGKNVYKYDVGEDEYIKLIKRKS